MNDDTPTDTSVTLPYSHPLTVAKLPTRTNTEFDLQPSEADCAAIAADLDIPALRKLRFKGTLAAAGNKDWVLKARLGATVVQTCVATLEPVTTRIEDPVARRWTRDLPDFEAADEVEMPDDESLERLSDVIDLGEVMTEALALSLPLYPRVNDDELDVQVFAEDGVKPMTDEDARPFAGLADLRNKLAKGGDDTP